MIFPETIAQQVLHIIHDFDQLHSVYQIKT